MPTLGIDVSSYQGVIDWPQVRRGDIQFAILRAGFGRFPNQEDQRFEDNYRQATAAGIAVGAYLYSYATTAGEAREEAKNLMGWLRGKQLEYPVYYDLEARVQSTLSRQRLTDIAAAFCEEMEAAGYFVGIYASEYWLTHKLDMERLRAYTVWLAEYAPRPTYQGSYRIWQYSSTGAVPGIHGHCDMDYSYEDFPRIIRENGLNGFSRGARPSRPSDPAPEVPRYVTYTVRRGDTLSGIAARFHTTWEELARLNRLADPNRLYPGQVLRVPAR